MAHTTINYGARAPLTGEQVKSIMYQFKWRLNPEKVKSKLKLKPTTESHEFKFGILEFKDNFILVKAVKLKSAVQWVIDFHKKYGAPFKDKNGEPIIFTQGEGIPAKKLFEAGFVRNLTTWEIIMAAKKNAKKSKKNKVVEFNEDSDEMDEEEVEETEDGDDEDEDEDEDDDEDDKKSKKGKSKSKSKKKDDDEDDDDDEDEDEDEDEDDDDDEDEDDEDDDEDEDEDEEDDKKSKKGKSKSKVKKEKKSSKKEKKSKKGNKKEKVEEESPESVAEKMAKAFKKLSEDNMMKVSVEDFNGAFFGEESPDEDFVLDSSIAVADKGIFITEADGYVLFIGKKALKSAKKVTAKHIEKM